MGNSTNDPLRPALGPRPSDSGAFLGGWGATDIFPPGHSLRSQEQVRHRHP
jgi:hypothetical protein